MASKFIMDIIFGLKMLMWIFACVLFKVSTEDIYIEPTVSLVSCLTSTIVLRITNGQAAGVMYIKADMTAYNMQYTENGTMVYSCRFTDCSIAWNSPFTFVIQRKVEIQTVHDVHLLFTCVWDQSDITPDNDVNKDQDSINTEFFVFGAVASMKFYNNYGVQLITGSYIKLGTNVTMEIKLQDTYDELLDINVKSCEASGIEIIQDRCPLDEDLFDSFNKTAVGALENIFQMFRITSNNPEPVSMFFSCLLEVCYAPCVKYNCNGTIATAESNRRRRDSEGPGQVAKSMTVGSLFKVGMGDPVAVTEDKPADCIAMPVLVSTIALFGFLLLLSISAFIYYWREWKEVTAKQPALDKARENAQKCGTEGLKCSMVSTSKNTNGSEAKVIDLSENKVTDTVPGEISERGKEIISSAAGGRKMVENSILVSKVHSLVENTLNKDTDFKFNTHVHSSSVGQSAVFRRSYSSDETSRISNIEKMKGIQTFLTQIKNDGMHLRPQKHFKSSHSQDDKTELPCKRVSFLPDNYF